MRMLVAAATGMEVEPFVAAFGGASAAPARLRRLHPASHQVDVLITGVGMVATAVWCSRSLTTEAYDVALNLGVCGSFNPAFRPGDVVHVVSDRLPELGAESDDAFLSAQELELLGPDEFPFSGGELVNRRPPESAPLGRLPAVRGITVNTVHGHAPSIARVVERFAPDVETMEGAAFMYACLVHGVPFAQIRGVSNVVEPRNRGAWKIREAIDAVCRAAREIVDQA